MRRLRAQMPHSLALSAGVPAPSDGPSKDARSTRALTAALMIAASPACLATYAMAQSQLPPLSVESQKAKKAAPAKKAPAKQPEPPAAASAQPSKGLPSPYNPTAASSPKMTGPLVDTPQTVTVVPRAIIEERAAKDLTEVLKNTPGISFSAGENGFGSGLTNFQVRGFDSTGSIFIDGVRDSGNYKRDVFNVDGVEIVKGAAADNGRGTAGGYVNIITKSPLLENFISGETSVSWSEYDGDPLWRSTLDVNQFKGNVAVRLNAFVEDGGLPGRGVAESKAWGVAPSVAFGLGTPFRAIFKYEHLERNDLPDWGVPGATVKGLVTYNPLTAGASRDSFYGLFTDYDDVRSDALTARFEYTVVPGVVVSNQTRWSQTDRTSLFTIPTGFTAPSTVTSSLQAYDRVNDIISNQTNLSGTFLLGGLKHVVSTGVELSHETSRAGQYTAINPGNTSLFDPDPGRFFGTFPAPVGKNAVDIDSVGAYFYDTIHLSRQWLLVGGLRADYYSYDVKFDGVTTAEDSYATLGGKIGLVYKMTENGSLYASYGRSGLPPGSYLSNPDISRNNDDQAMVSLIPGAKPVEIDNYEAGIKWNFFNGKLTTSAAVFRTEKNNIAYKGAPGFDPIVYGSQIAEGVELGIAGNITERLKVFGGVTWLHTQRVHGAAVDEAAKAANANDYVVDGVPVDTTNGDALAFTPSFFANLWLTYAVTEKLTLGGGVRYVGDSWLGRPDDANRIIPNGKFGKLPDYFTVNFMAAYELSSNWDLRFNIDNVFDETYAVSSNWAGSRVFLGDPRTFRLGLSYKY